MNAAIGALKKSHINIPCGQNLEPPGVQAGGT
jgi:hypothetical protein